LLATFRIVLELLIEKEELFAGCKDKIRPAVGTFENFVDEIHPASLAFARSTRGITPNGWRVRVAQRLPRQSLAFCDTPVKPARYSRFG
jgi:hypothetical protein